jgi:hypothetical protein
MAVAFGDEEARRVEPWFPFPQFQVVPGPAALFGMLGEGPAVQRQPLVLVLAGHEAAQRPARRERRLVQRLTQRATHLPQGTEALEPGRPGQRGGRGQIAVGPEPQDATIRRHRELAGQRPAESLPPAIWVNDELAGHLALAPFIPRRRIQVGVARDPPARDHEEIPAAVGAAVAQPQHPVLRERRHAVGQPRRLDQGQDLTDLGGGKFSAGDLRFGHRVAAAVWSRAPLARSSAVARSPLTGTKR